MKTGSGAANVRIVTICTANICRSPALASQLRAAVAGLPLAINVSSRGVNVLEPGRPRCPRIPEILQLPIEPGGSNGLSATDVSDAELVVTATGAQAGSIVRKHPGDRRKVFTVAAFADLAEWIVRSSLPIAILKARGADLVELTTFEQGIAALPVEPVERIRWLVTEADASRGLAPVSYDQSTPDAGDIPDPHGVGDHVHEQAAALITTNVDRIGAAIAAVLAANP